MDLHVPYVNLEIEGPRPRPEEGPGSRLGLGIPGEQRLREAHPEGRPGPEALYRNQALLEGYLEGRRLSNSGRENYVKSARSFSGLVGVPLEEAGPADVEEWYRAASARALEPSTILRYAVHLRALIQFAHVRRGLSRVEARARAAEILEAVPWVDLRREDRQRRQLRDKIVTPEELSAMMAEADHPRAQALVAVLEESACRKSELIGLRIRDVGFEETHAEIRVLGKTGERTVPLVRSVPYLKAWLEAHPDPRPGAPLFATVRHGEARRMARSAPNHLLRDLCWRAGLRPIHPHMLRHTRLTELARKGLGEYQLKSFAGWTPDSQMAARYIHLSGRAHVSAVLAAEGVAIEAQAMEAEG